jgi:hypothetical protein
LEATQLGEIRLGIIRLEEIRQQFPNITVYLFTDWKDLCEEFKKITS